MTVSIEGDTHIFVNESGGFVGVCMMADHDSQASYEVILTTTDGSATGKDEYLPEYSRHFPLPQLMRTTLL